MAPRHRLRTASSLLTVVLSIGVLSSCDDAQPIEPIEPLALFSTGDAVPCSDMEEYNPTNNPTCTLDAIWVWAPPRNEPDTYDPPPPPPWPETPLPSYTPPDGGWGKIWRTTYSPEANPPEIEGPYAEGPTAFAACILGGLGLMILKDHQDTQALLEAWRREIWPLHFAEFQFQIRKEMAKAGVIGDDVLEQYRGNRDMAQVRYDMRKQDFLDHVRSHRATGWAELGVITGGCALAAWLPSL